jgi:acylphosphatase
MTAVRARVFVQGRVQGVFFRDSTRLRALELGLTGFARNLSDGRVEAVFEGEESAVERAIAFVREGPAFARVFNDAATTEIYTGEFSGFRVTR